MHWIGHPWAWVQGRNWPWQRLFQHLFVQYYKLSNLFPLLWGSGSHPALGWELWSYQVQLPISMQTAETEQLYSSRLDSCVVLSSEKVRLDPFLSVQIVKQHARKTGCFREILVLFYFISVLYIFPHHRVSTGLCTSWVLHLWDYVFFMSVQMIYILLWGRHPHLIKSVPTFMVKFQCIFVRTMSSCLIPCASAVFWVSQKSFGGRACDTLAVA